MTAQRSGSARAIARNASRSVSWKARPSLSNRSASSPSPRRAAARARPLGDRQIQDQGQIRPAGADRDALQAGEQLRVELAGRALIGARRIGEAVANHPVAAAQRRRDRRVDMVDARGAEQQRLADGAEARGGAGKNDFAQRLGAGRAAGLARENDVEPEFAQARRRAGAPGPTCPRPRRLRA